LRARRFIVHLVDNKTDALKAILALFNASTTTTPSSTSAATPTQSPNGVITPSPSSGTGTDTDTSSNNGGASSIKGVSFSVAGCQSLSQIGFTEWAKNQTDHLNYKAMAVAAITNRDMAGYKQHINSGMTADRFVTTPAAVTEDGRLVINDYDALTDCLLCHTNLRSLLHNITSSFFIQLLLKPNEISIILYLNYIMQLLLK
jgi:hypothetical protein